LAFPYESYLGFGSCGIRGFAFFHGKDIHGGTLLIRTGMQGDDRIDAQVHFFYRPHKILGKIEFKAALLYFYFGFGKFYGIGFIIPKSFRSRSASPQYEE
jgi:hypothetical protein